MSKKRILLVDDEEELVMAVQARLEANDYEVMTAYDGEDGLRKAREGNLDLIILDVMLPKMDGYKVCATLKHDERHQKTPVLLFTAKASDEDVRIGLEDCRADGYLTKPFDASMLLKKIQELMK
jgi:adenylate cyclase